MPAAPPNRPPHPVLALFGRALERVLAQVLSLDPDTHARLAALEGRAIAIDFSGDARRLPAMRVAIEQGQVRIGPAYAAGSELQVAATPASLLAFALSRDGAIAPGKVTISGDAELARRLEQVARSFAPDFDEAFARAFGDVAGYQLARALRAALAWARASARALAADTAEFLTEEGRDLVACAELDAFLDDVDAARERADRVEARLRRLAARMPARA